MCLGGARKREPPAAGVTSSHDIDELVQELSYSYKFTALELWRKSFQEYEFLHMICKHFYHISTVKCNILCILVLVAVYQ